MCLVFCSCDCGGVRMDLRTAGNWVWKYQAAVVHRSAGMRTLFCRTKRSNQGGKGNLFDTNRAILAPDAIKRNGPNDKAWGWRSSRRAAGSGPCGRAAEQAWRYASTVAFISSWQRSWGKPRCSSFRVQDRCARDWKQHADRKAGSDRKRTRLSGARAVPSLREFTDASRTNPGQLQILRRLAARYHP
ncbi:hypothetical protein P3T40_000292 [Paraburkholderia sp. EB58]|jgi:hypothetical protein